MNTKTLKDLMDLTGRVAVITGGAGHIGTAMAEALAELGARVVLVDLTAAACQEAAERLTRDFGVETLGLAVDISQDEAVRTIPARVLETFGRLDILINNAALVGTSQLKGWNTPFEQQSVETWRLALEVNLTAAFLLTQCCTPALRESGNGSIINIGSIYGVVAPDLRIYGETGIGNPAAYAASKSGLIQFTRWLSTVLAPEVRANAITPGGVWRNQAEDFHQRYVAKTPLGRMATETDIKGATAYLASNLSSYVTGQNLIVDGGWTAW
jgi:NAD(P)-dependent dehydrogenase (short-subunit alcohol dehydrogenase family)